MSSRRRQRRGISARDFEREMRAAELALRWEAVRAARLGNHLVVAEIALLVTALVAIVLLSAGVLASPLGAGTATAPLVVFYFTFNAVAGAGPEPWPSRPTCCCRTPPPEGAGGTVIDHVDF